MKKKIILVFILILVVAGVWYFIMARRVATPTAPPITPGVVSTSTEVQIQTVTPGQNIQVKNPYKEAVSSSTQYNDILMVSNPDYDIQFFVLDNSFNITLRNSDIWKARAEAEQALLQRLGISQQDACKLKVSLGIPVSVNALFPGVNFGLSFCPGSVSLPDPKTTPRTGIGTQDEGN